MSRWLRHGVGLRAWHIVHEIQLCVLTLKEAFTGVLSSCHRMLRRMVRKPVAPKLLPLRTLRVDTWQNIDAASEPMESKVVPTDVSSFVDAQTDANRDTSEADTEARKWRQGKRQRVAARRRDLALEMLQRANEEEAALENDANNDCDKISDEGEKTTDKNEEGDELTGETDECEETNNSPVIDALTIAEDGAAEIAASISAIDEQWSDSKGWNNNDWWWKDWWSSTDWQPKKWTWQDWPTTPLPTMQIHQSTLSERAHPPMWPSRPLTGSSVDSQGPDPAIWQVMQDQQMRHTKDFMHLLGHQQQQQQQQHQQQLLLYRQLQQEQQQQHLVVGTVHERPLYVANTPDGKIVHHGWIG